MTELCWLLAVVRREHGEDYVSFFREHGVTEILSGLCEGTAQKKTLNLLGLESRELTMLNCLVPASESKLLLRRLVRDMRIDAPNAGIALTVRIESALGAVPAGGEGDEGNMDESRYALVVAIVDKGSSDAVMDAARSAGAQGGTVVRAKGTGAKIAPRFFGVSIADEKELVYIVARRETKDGIMEAVAGRVKQPSGNRACVFAVPVSGTAGLFQGDED